MPRTQLGTFEDIEISVIGVGDKNKLHKINKSNNKSKTNQLDSS